MRFTATGALAGAAFLAGACVERTPRDLALVRDSAGIAIVENITPDDSAAYAWWSIAELVLDIGDDTGDPAQALFRVVDAHRRRDGTIVVANAGSSELRVFSANGRHLATWGRQGGGPGEFQTLSAILPGTADSLLVWDARARRISVFDRNGNLAYEFGLGDGAPATPIGRLANGDIIAWSLNITPGGGPPPEGVQRPATPVMRFTAAGQLADTIGVFAGAERIVRVSTRNGQILSIEVATPPFARSSYHAVAPDEVLVGTQETAEIRAYAPNGMLQRIVRTGMNVRAVTPQHVEAWIEQRVSAVAPEARQRVREGLQALPHGEMIPPYGMLLTDAAGNLWIADYDDPLRSTGRWTVYAPDGRGIARIVLPDRFQPYEIGSDWILGRELDALDIEHVRLYRFTQTRTPRS